MLPETLAIALKEWAAVIHALRAGRQIVLLRKGGIYEAAGEFEIEHRQFLLLPTYLHQSREQIKPSEHHRLEVRSTEPAEIVLDTAAEITEIIPLASRHQLQRIDAAHIWAAPLIDMRFNYKPQNPLYLLLVRTYLLAAPVTIANSVELAGCKSWVPLPGPVATNARPALDDKAFAQATDAILRAITAQPPYN